MPPGHTQSANACPLLAHAFVPVAASQAAALDGADGLLVMADWDHFLQADLEAIRRRMRRPLVIDCVGVLEPRRAEMAGVEYVSMGR